MTQRPEAGPDSFVHLHVHSEFSLLDGLSRLGEMTRRVADQGMTATALTGSMYGVIPSYAAAKTAGIKRVIGIEASGTETSAMPIHHHVVLQPLPDHASG